MAGSGNRGKVTLYGVETTDREAVNRDFVASFPPGCVLAGEPVTRENPDGTYDVTFPFVYRPPEA